MANPMSKRWCFTINYWREPLVPGSGLKPADMEYMVCQRELAPTTGQTHWQGYLRCATRKRMTTIKRLLNRENAHLEIARVRSSSARTTARRLRPVRWTTQNSSSSAATSTQKKVPARAKVGVLT